MFLSKIEDFLKVAKAANFTILSAPGINLEEEIEKEYRPNVIILNPDEKTGKISVEQVRDFVALTRAKDNVDKFFIVTEAEKMTPAAENAFLKSLEEPKKLHHFILLTNSSSALLPTTLSRAQVFLLRDKKILERPIMASDKAKEIAKRMVVADTKELIKIAEEVSKKKDGARQFGLEIAGAGVEILYKTYFLTGQKKFLKRLPNFLKLYEDLEKNGHIKLHFVSDMI